MFWYLQLPYFNSHPHEEDDPGFSIVMGNIVVFQLTSSWRGWRSFTFAPCFIASFQLTSSWRGWHYPHLTPSNTGIFQLTSSWRGWHYGRVWLRSWLTFQLTSSWRGWLLHVSLLLMLLYFNSHPHEEDDSIEIHPFSLPNISTHILMKRMTWLAYWITVCDTFQLTSSWRGWPHMLSVR